MLSIFMPKNLKVRTRLYCGFLALIAVAVSLAGAGSWGIGRVGGQVSKLEAVGSNVQRVLTAKALLEVIRRTQLRYMFEGDAASVTEMKATQAEAKEVMAAASANTLSAERLTIYNSVSARIADQPRLP